MSESYPKVAARIPAMVDLEPGTYHWCSCGLSAKQPFCDGAHKVTSMAPLKVEVLERGPRALCQCKQTRNAPFCDGAHCGL